LQLTDKLFNSIRHINHWERKTLNFLFELSVPYTPTAVRIEQRLNLSFQDQKKSRPSSECFVSRRGRVLSVAGSRIWGRGECLFEVAKVSLVLPISFPLSSLLPFSPLLSLVPFFDPSSHSFSPPPCRCCPSYYFTKHMEKFLIKYETITTHECLVFDQS
jgi:hypothetical protein